MYILRTPAEIIPPNLRIRPDILRCDAENMSSILRILIFINTLGELETGWLATAIRPTATSVCDAASGEAQQPHSSTQVGFPAEPHSRHS